MAKRVSNIRFTGTIDGLCFYEMNGKSYVRMKSSLTGNRVKTSPGFRRTMVYANLMSRASKIGSVVYSALPKNFRQFWMYRAFTGEAMQWLKAGKPDEEVKEILWKTYVEVWIHKEAEKLQQTMSDTLPVKRKATVQKRGRSMTITQQKVHTAPINSFFSIPWKKTTSKINPGNAGRSSLRRSRKRKQGIKYRTCVET